MSDTPPEDFKNIEEILKKILSQAFGASQGRSGIIGVNIILAGGFPPGFSGTAGPNRDVEQPEIELTEWDNKITATCEMKGLSDDQINVALSENVLHIIGYDGKTRYRSSIQIPPVEEGTCVRTFNNGILELNYEILKHGEEEQKADTVSPTEESELSGEGSVSHTQ